MSLSGLAVCLGVAAGTSFGRAQFELFLMLLMASGMALSREAVSVRVWSTWAAPALAPAGGAVHPTPPFGTGGETASSSE